MEMKGDVSFDIHPAAFFAKNSQWRNFEIVKWGLCEGALNMPFTDFFMQLKINNVRVLK